MTRLLGGTGGCSKVNIGGSQHYNNIALECIKVVITGLIYCGDSLLDNMASISGHTQAYQSSVQCLLEKAVRYEIALGDKNN